MNKKRKKKITDIYSKLESIYDQLQSIAEEEQEAYDNLELKNLGDTDKAISIQEKADALNDIVTDFQTLLDNLCDVAEIEQVRDENNKLCLS